MLLKTDELSVVNMTKRKLMTLANGAECLSTKFLDNWVTNNNNNYRKLRTSRISRSCQTMLDHPSMINMSSHWTTEDTVLLENWMAEKPEESTQQSKENRIVIDEIINDNEDQCFNSLDENISCKSNDTNTQILQPIIKMEGDLLEIEYYIDDKDGEIDYNQQDNNNNNNKENKLPIPNEDYITKTDAQEFCCRTSTDRNKDHKPNTPKIPPHKIANNRGLSPRRCQKYKEFLVKSDNKACTAEDNEINHEVNENQHKSENLIPKKIEYEFDEHRPLPQILSESCNEQNINILKKEESIMYERGGSARVKTKSNEVKSEIKSFLSFRYPNKKNVSEKKIKKKYVTSEEGASGPIWPAVLLTYDRGVSLGIPESEQTEKQL